MSRAKIAPTLTTNILRFPPLDWRGTEPLGEMQAELRALLAAVKAADKALMPGGQWIEASGGSAVALLAYQRARARLDRVSGLPGRGRAR